MTTSILEQSRAVRTLLFEEIEHTLNEVSVDWHSVRPYRTSIVEWLKPVIDLDDFFVYPMNGITEGLNWWMAHEERSIVMDDGDYQWVQSCLNGREAIKYMSVPSAIDGNMRSIPNYIPVALDLAYVGSIGDEYIELTDNVEYAFYSFSKAFGLRNIRTGYLFSRKPIPRLDDLIHKAKYFNYYANDASELLMRRFDVDYIYNKLRLPQLDICDELNLTPSDSVWLATSDDPMYDKFKRGGVNRICLAPFYSEL